MICPFSFRGLTRILFRPITFPIFHESKSIKAWRLPKFPAMMKSLKEIRSFQKEVFSTSTLFPAKNLIKQRDSLNIISNIQHHTMGSHVLEKNLQHTEKIKTISIKANSYVSYFLRPQNLPNKEIHFLKTVLSNNRYAEKKKSHRFVEIFYHHQQSQQKLSSATKMGKVFSRFERFNNAVMLTKDSSASKNFQIRPDNHHFRFPELSQNKNTSTQVGRTINIGTLVIEGAAVRDFESFRAELSSAVEGL